ncbi:hypothetical protein EUA04_01455 [Mycolicibacterium obuense]|uniref:DUF4386 domain-containing protein n=1 Tax=Mycolicibacterium obuense TaxID=1807 RepID=A0A4R5XBJ3_9MYCO|nr:hypothetical protein [Mycolicibacterium obuense]TDL11695.1 hypothetical protein EUA04_01455 [Mycolicibacterium obuense]
MTETRSIKLLIWCGPASIGLVLIGWMVCAGFLPPPTPTATGASLNAIWNDHPELKRLGMVLCIWGGCLYAPFTVAIAIMLRRGDPERLALPLAQAALGIFGTVFFTLNFLVLSSVAFRPEQAPEDLQAMHDLGFIMTFSPVAPFTLQYVLIALFIVSDESPNPSFPRWVGYANLWVAVLFVPACAIPFFKTGVMAWNGLLAFWIPVGVFVIWFVIMAIMMRKRLADEESAVRISTADSV